jgi:hypothetical protein
LRVVSRRVTHAARRRELVQARVPERVLAAGLVVTPDRGTNGQSGHGGLMDPAAGHAPDRAAHDGSGELPSPVWLAVTPTRIYVFAARHGDVGELLGAWDRERTAVRKTRRVTGTRLHLSFGGSGPPTAVETRRGMGGNRQLVSLLLDPSRTA